MVECCFSSVRCTKAEDVTLNFGARGLTGFNLEEVGRARLRVFEPLSGASAEWVRLFFSVPYQTRELEGTSVDHAMTAALLVASSMTGPLVIRISCPAWGAGAA